MIAGFAFVLKYYKELTFGFLTLIALYLFWEKDQQIETLRKDNVAFVMENLTLEAKLKEANSQLMAQNILLEANKVEYKKALTKFPVKLETIKTRYVAVYKDIEKYKGEANASDCNGAISKLNDFTF